MRLKSNGMPRDVIATPLFSRNLEGFLDEYAAKGATRFVERLYAGYKEMTDNIAKNKHIGLAKRRTVKGKTITIRQYIIDAGARNFVVLYWVPPQKEQPVLLLNIRISGQNRFRWD